MLIILALVRLRQVSQVQDHPGLYIETLSFKNWDKAKDNWPQGVLG